jgi:RNA polymerase sigma factor (sigma-70 family)
MDTAGNMPRRTTTHHLRMVFFVSISPTTTLPSSRLGVRVGSIYRFMKQETLETVFMEAFDAYSDAIFRFCVVKVSDIERAEDMTQEVFTRFWQYVKDEKEITNPRAFLYTIANNLAKDWYKKKKSESLDMHLDNGLAPVSKELSPEMLSEYQEVLAAMTDMEERDREVLYLRFVEGFEPRDIAETLGETANAVSVRLNRAMAKLKQKMNV